MSKDIVKASPSGALDTRREEFQLEAAGKAVNAAADVVSLLVKGGHVFLETKQIEAKSAAGWEETRQKIATLDAETTMELKILEGQLQGAKEKTQRLAMLLDFATKRQNLPKSLSEGIAKAIENCTREP